jgi:hypothetical protein
VWGGLRASAFVVLVVVESFFVLFEVLWLEAFDVVEDEVIEEDVVGLFLVADAHAALGALVQVDEVLREAELAEGVFAEGGDRVCQVVVAQRAENSHSFDLPAR